MKTYYCNVSYMSYGKAYVKAASEEEAIEKFGNDEYMDIIGIEEDDNEYDLTSIKEGR